MILCNNVFIKVKWFSYSAHKINFLQQKKVLDQFIATMNLLDFKDQLFKRCRDLQKCIVLRKEKVPSIFKRDFKCVFDKIVSPPDEVVNLAHFNY